ncbi:MAG: hypothetical protein HQK51_20465, partial [Oligoflexia bacterium]|nr:hypothetical protein [Oligoflexia bacterium]
SQLQSSIDSSIIETKDEKEVVVNNNVNKVESERKIKLIDYKKAPIIGDVDKIINYEVLGKDLIACVKSQRNFSHASNTDDVSSSSNSNENYFRDIISCLEGRFKEFKIDGRIVNVIKGPVVDTFELELGAGIKVSRVTSITEDLSLSLYGVPIRMIYPMKGKNTIGIEIPHHPRDVIFLDEIITSTIFSSNKHNLPIALGKNTFGEVFVEDLASMPHMLIAGATGSGKSVFINALLVSLLVKKSPDKMRLLLIDPKQLELILYSSLPHLLLPVVTTSSQASAALIWAIDEMDRRYMILKELGVRNIEGFNEKIKTAPREIIGKIRVLYPDDEEQLELPYIVIIVDEFADLILSKFGRDIELSICKLAAKARASGIHLIIATQRPSVDVITGLIKSNFPTRISFRVSSNIDSRTILNSLGAEKLLGKGDMLYRNGIDMLRIHSAYVEEEEIASLINKMACIPAKYDENAIFYLNANSKNENNNSNYSDIGDSHSFSSCHSENREEYRDSLYGEAIKLITEEKTISVSMLQRRLRIGFNRAANIIETLEAQGVVGPQIGQKPREVLINPQM